MPSNVPCICLLRRGLRQCGPGEVGLGPHLQLATPQPTSATGGTQAGRSLVVRPVLQPDGSDTPAPPASAPGSAGEKLGDGASGDVYRATLLATGEPVAVKVFR
jgi:hypothetical protein